jgi:ParB family chromosome partitioning protein
MTEDAPRPPAEKTKPARGLGRGLSALFGEEKETVVAVTTAPVAETTVPPKDQRSLATDSLFPSRFQPRRHFDDDAMQALADSVKAKGILQPILVRRSPDDPARYEILAGERRWRAAQVAQLHEVPVIIRDITDREASEIALVENIQRQDLNPIEEGEGYHRLIEEFGHTQEVLAQALGKSRSHIANTMRLLVLPAEVKAMIAAGTLTAGHARALITARDPIALAKQIVAQGMSVRQIEAALRAERDGPTKVESKPRTGGKDANVTALEKELTQRMGLKVLIETEGESGALTIHYRTLDQLDEVLKRLRS